MLKIRRGLKHLLDLILGVIIFFNFSLPKLQFDTSIPVSHNIANAFDSIKNIPFAQDKKRDSLDTSLERQFYELDVHVKKHGRIAKEQIYDVIRMIYDKTLLLIRCCGNFLVTESLPERKKIVHHVIELCHKMNIMFDISHHNSLIKLYIENKMYDEVKETQIMLNGDDIMIQKCLSTLFKPLGISVDAKIKPSRITYQRLVCLFAESGQIDKAEIMLENMKNKDIPINENIFGSLISCYGNNHDLENIMKELGLEPTSLVISRLCQAFLYLGKIDEIDKTLKDAQNEGIMLLNRDLLDIMYATIVQKIGSEDVKKISEMLIPYLKPHMDLMQCLINTTCKLLSVGTVDVEAYEFFKFYSYTVGQNIDPLFNFTNTMKNSGHFILKQLQYQTNPNHSIETLRSIVTDMHETGINLYAAQKCLENYFNLTFNLPFDETYKTYLQFLHQLSLPVRPHYFWPILAKLSKDLDKNSCNLEANLFFDVLNVAKSDYGILPSVQTLGDFIYPFLEKVSFFQGIQEENLLSQMWKIYSEKFGRQNPKHDIFAINSLIYYAVSDISSKLHQSLTLRQLANFLGCNSNMEEKGVDTLNPQLFSSINTQPIYSNLKRIYNHSLNDQPENLLVDILAKLHFRLPNKNSNLDDMENVEQQIPTIPSNFDWNGKILSEVIEDSIKNRGEEWEEPIKRLLNKCVEIKIPVSRDFLLHLESDPTISTNPDLLNILKDFSSEPHLSLNKDLMTSQWQQDNASSTRQFQQDLSSLDHQIAFKDLSIDKLESTLSEMKQNLDGESSNSHSIVPVKMKSITRHLITRYAKEKESKKHEDRIRQLAFEMLRFDRINLKQLELDDPISITLEATLSTNLPPPTHLSLLNYQDGSINMPSSATNFILNSYSCLVDFFGRVGDGDTALKFKKAREMIFPPYKMSVPKILELCTALTGQILSSMETSSTTLSMVNTMRRNQMLDLLREASTLPLSYVTSNYYNNSNNQQQLLENQHNQDTSNEFSNSQTTSPSTSSMDPQLTSRNAFKNLSSNVSPRSNTEYQAWKLLNLASGGSVEAGILTSVKEDSPKVLKDFGKIYESVIELLKNINGNVNPSVGVLGTLVNAQLNSDNLNEALDVFYKCAADYHVTPQMTVLMCKLIDMNDTGNLQKLVDVSSEIHGEANILIDLLFAFITLGRFKEANKVLETPNMHYRQSRFEFYCNRLLRFNKVKELEYLAQASKSRKDIDRDNIFYYVLRAYDKTNDKDAAIQLWESWLDDEDTNYHLFAKSSTLSAERAGESTSDAADVSPDVVYRYRSQDSKVRNLILLGQILLRNGFDENALPFTLPLSHKNYLIDTSTPTTSATDSSKEAHSVGDDMMYTQDIDKDKELSRFLYEGKLDKAIALKNQLLEAGKSLSPRTFSLLLENLVKRDDLVDEALKVSKEMTQKNLFVPVPMVKSLLSKLSQLGRFNEIKNHIPAIVNNPLVLTKLNIPKYESYAYTNSGKFLEYIQPFFDKLSEDPLSSANQLPQGIIYALSKHPEYYDKVADLAKMFEERANSNHLYSLLFTYRILSNDFTKARELYEDKLKLFMKNSESTETSSPKNNNDTPQETLSSSLNGKVFFNIITICKNAKSTNDESALKFLIEEIGLNGDKGQLGLAFSYWISLKCHNSEYDSALNLYNRAIQEHELTPQHLKVFALRELKNCLTSQGKPIPFDTTALNNSRYEQSEFSDKTTLQQSV